jgi:hypothetical protein
MRRHRCLFVLSLSHRILQVTAPEKKIIFALVMDKAVLDTTLMTSIFMISSRSATQVGVTEESVVIGCQEMQEWSA